MTNDTPQTTPAPAWMRRWLVAAGAYNIVWGATAVLAPVWSLKILGRLSSEHGPVAAALGVHRDDRGRVRPGVPDRCA